MTLRYRYSEWDGTQEDPPLDPDNVLGSLSDDLMNSGDLQRAPRKVGFVKARQRGSHARWKHPDGRATTLPVHPSREIGGWLFHEILSQLDISKEEFRLLV